MNEGDEGYWTFSQWADATIEKIVRVAETAPREHRADWLEVQIRAAIMHALRHGRSGRADDDPVVQ